MTSIVLSCRNVAVIYRTGACAVRDISLTISAGECLALVGESGCGKTTLARAMLGLLPEKTHVTGSIQVNGREVVGASPAMLRQMRGLVVGYVAQDPLTACNPLNRVADHVAEAWYAHGQQPPQGVIASMLDRLGIPQAATIMHRYPHQWSGGMLQRATIAAAAVHHPALIIADEPTSALDANLAAVTLATLRATGAALLLVSHDLGLVAQYADTIAICYAGRIVEIADTATVLRRPLHPYTIGLLKALPQPGAGLPEPLPGAPPNPRKESFGCAFAPRCAWVLPACQRDIPVLSSGVACPVRAPAGHTNNNAPAHHQNSTRQVETNGVATDSLEHNRPRNQLLDMLSSTPVVAAYAVSKLYTERTLKIQVVVHAELEVQRGEIVGICGPSGCGKSTLLRLLAAIERPTTGTVYLGGKQVSNGDIPRLLHPIARSGFVMPVFQNPRRSLDSGWPIWRTITEPLMAMRYPTRPTTVQRRTFAQARLHDVGMGHTPIDLRPDQLSLGQCQRVALARALTAQPALLIADEPTSALDTSVAAAILQLLTRIARSGTAIIIVSHDLAMLQVLCQRVLIMRSGVLTA